MDADTLTNPVVVKVDSNMSVTANFMSLIPRYAIDLTIEGEGSVALDPEPYLGKYDSAQVVYLKAETVQGSARRQRNVAQFEQRWQKIV